MVGASVHYAQHTLRAVRHIDHQDVRGVGTRGADNTNAMVREALVQTLGRDTYLTPQNNGYTSPDSLQRADPTLTREQAMERALERNRVRGSQVQGMVFADDPALAVRVQEAMEQVRSGTYPEIDSLQRGIAEQRRTAELRAREAMGAAPQALEAVRNAPLPAINLGSELAAAQRNAIANFINIDIIQAINPQAKLSKMERAVRADSGLASFLPETLLDRQTTLNTLQERARTAPAEQAAYYREVIRGMEALYAAQAEGRPLRAVLVTPENINLSALNAGGSVRLSGTQNVAIIQQAEWSLNHGLATHVVSDGPLGTGYSNSHILSTTSLISQEPGVGHAQTMSQHLGRPIRDADRVAQGAVVVSANVNPDHVFTAEQIFSAENSQHYTRAVQAEQQRTSTVRPPFSSTALPTDLSGLSVITRETRFNIHTQEYNTSPLARVSDGSREYFIKPVSAEEARAHLGALQTNLGDNPIIHYANARSITVDQLPPALRQQYANLGNQTLLLMESVPYGNGITALLENGNAAQARQDRLRGQPITVAEQRQLLNEIGTLIERGVVHGDIVSNINIQREANGRLRAYVIDPAPLLATQSPHRDITSMASALADMQRLGHAETVNLTPEVNRIRAGARSPNNPVVPARILDGIIPAPASLAETITAPATRPNGEAHYVGELSSSPRTRTDGLPAGTRGFRGAMPEPPMVAGAAIPGGVSEPPRISPRQQRPATPGNNAPNSPAATIPTPVASPSAPSPFRRFIRVGNPGGAANVGLALGGLGQGLIQRDPNNPSAVGDALIGANATVLATDMIAVPTLETVSRIMNAGRAAAPAATGAVQTGVRVSSALSNTASGLRTFSSAAGNTLAVLGMGMSAYSAYESNNNVSRGLHVANVGLGGAGVVAATTGWTGVGLAVAGTMVVVSTGAEILEIQEASRQAIERQTQAHQGAAVTRHYVGGHLGTNASLLPPRTEEYKQISAVIRDLGADQILNRDYANVISGLRNPLGSDETPNWRDPRVLRTALNDGIRAMERRIEEMPAAEREASPLALRLRQFREARIELDGNNNFVGYQSRYEAAQARQNTDPERTARLNSFMERSFQLERLRENGQLTPEAVQQDMLQGMTQARNDMIALAGMSREEQRRFLDANSAFLRDNGISPTSPLANAMLTNENFMERASALGLDNNALGRMGLGSIRRSAELSTLDLQSPANLERMRAGDATFDADRRRVTELLTARNNPNLTAAGRASLDQLVEVQGGYARLGNYYNINLRDYGINVPTPATRREEMERSHRREDVVMLLQNNLTQNDPMLRDRMTLAEEARRLNINLTEYGHDLFAYEPSAGGRPRTLARESLLQLLQNMPTSPTGSEAFTPENRRDLERLLQSPVARELLGPVTYNANETSPTLTMADRWQLQRLATQLHVNLNDYGIQNFAQMPENQQQMLTSLSDAVRNGNVSVEQRPALEGGGQRIVMRFTDQAALGAMTTQLQSMLVDFQTDGSPLSRVSGGMITLDASSPTGAFILQELARNQPPARSNPVDLEGDLLRSLGVLPSAPRVRPSSGRLPSPTTPSSGLSGTTAPEL